MADSAPWFPIVFADKCDGCAKQGKPRCVEYCPHSVYAFENGKAVVAQPLKCVKGCTSCKPLCHSKAIAFPEPTRAQKPPEDKGLIRKTVCVGCGKVFWTNMESDFCLDCKNKRQEAAE